MQELKLYPLQYEIDSQNYFERLADLRFSCWLDSGKPSSELGRYDIISALPQRWLISDEDSTRIFQHHDVDNNPMHHSRKLSDPLFLLEKELSKISHVATSDIPFTGGAIGYCGYGIGKDYIIKNLGNSKIKSEANQNLPEMFMGIYLWALIQDHQEKQSYLVKHPDCDEAIFNQIIERLHREYPENTRPKDFECAPFKPRVSKERYLSDLSKIKDYINAGDCYQVNYAQLFEARYTGNHYQAYLKLRKQLPSPFSAYINLGDQAILSVSPERFIEFNQNRVLTQPIKGTCPRGNTPEEDSYLAEQLLKSEKNRAENVMIVDLLRNDLGHCAMPGSVKVEKLCELQTFPNVHHLVSSISAKIDTQFSHIDAFRESFPGGSITGAPKKRAMEIIDELEPEQRGAYCGSIAYFSANQRSDSNIAIRTIAANQDILSCWGGGGIVSDSNPEEEFQETLTKIGRLLSAITD